MSASRNIMQKYGPPDDHYFAKYGMTWNVVEDFKWSENILIMDTVKPLKRILINKEFQSKLKTAFTNLERAGLHTEIKTYDGCYNNRSVRGSESKSLHAWAMAIDLNASLEKLGQSGTHWSAQFVAIMKAAGLFWGGDWRGRKDNMHFALFNG